MPGDFGYGAVIVPADAFDQAGMTSDPVKSPTVQQVPAQGVRQHVTNGALASARGAIYGDNRHAGHRSISQG